MPKKKGLERGGTPGPEGELGENAVAYLNDRDLHDPIAAVQTRPGRFDVDHRVRQRTKVTQLHGSSR